METPPASAQPTQTPPRTLGDFFKGTFAKIKEGFAPNPAAKQNRQKLPIQATDIGNRNVERVKDSNLEEILKALPNTEDKVAQEARSYVDKAFEFHRSMPSSSEDKRLLEILVHTAEILLKASDGKHIREIVSLPLFTNKKEEYWKACAIACTKHGLIQTVDALAEASGELKEACFQKMAIELVSQDNPNDALLKRYADSSGTKREQTYTRISVVFAQKGEYETAERYLEFVTKKKELAYKLMAVAAANNQAHEKVDEYLEKAFPKAENPEQKQAKAQSCLLISHTYGKKADLKKMIQFFYQAHELGLKDIKGFTDLLAVIAEKSEAADSIISESKQYSHTVLFTPILTLCIADLALKELQPKERAEEQARRLTLAYCSIIQGYIKGRNSASADTYLKKYKEMLTKVLTSTHKEGLEAKVAEKVKEATRMAALEAAKCGSYSHCKELAESSGCYTPDFIVQIAIIAANNKDHLKAESMLSDALLEKQSELKGNAYTSLAAKAQEQGDVQRALKYLALSGMETQDRRIFLNTLGLEALKREEYTDAEACLKRLKQLSDKN